jgi:hypothetical protein
MAIAKVFPSPLVRGGLEIKVLVYCSKWTEHGLASLQTTITGKYFFPAWVNAFGIHPDAFCKKGIGV